MKVKRSKYDTLIYPVRFGMVFQLTLFFRIPSRSTYANFSRKIQKLNEEKHPTLAETKGYFAKELRRKIVGHAAYQAGMKEFQVSDSVKAKDQELIKLAKGFIIACITEADGYEHEEKQIAYVAIDALKTPDAVETLEKIWLSIEKFKKMNKNHYKNFFRMTRDDKKSALREKLNVVWSIHAYVDQLNALIPDMPKSSEEEEGKRKFLPIIEEHDYMKGDEEWSPDDPAAVTPPPKKQKTRE